MATLSTAKNFAASLTLRPAAMSILIPIPNFCMQILSRDGVSSASANVVSIASTSTHTRCTSSEKLVPTLTIFLLVFVKSTRDAAVDLRAPP